MRTAGQQILTGERAAPPIARTLGFQLVSAAEGTAVFEMDVDERFWNPMGTLHGGILCDIADAAMGFAYASTLERQQSFTTVELKINFLRPVFKTRLRATGHIVKRGRKIGLVDCHVTDAQGKLVARASSTCMTLTAEDTKSS